MNSCWILIFIAFYSSSSWHVNTISIINLSYVVHGSEHEWLFNVFKDIFIRKSMSLMNDRDNKEIYVHPDEA